MCLSFFMSSKLYFCSYHFLEGQQFRLIMLFFFAVSAKKANSLINSHFLISPYSYFWVVVKEAKKCMVSRLIKSLTEQCNAFFILVILPTLLNAPFGTLASSCVAKLWTKRLYKTMVLILLSFHTEVYKIRLWNIVCIFFNALKL